ncbi:putative F-box domain-containing protein [Helianthus annuus]|nr:putative F-box domain-containing protein [Helianthus annuus]
MSDNIPLELQQLIINKLPVEPLIRFRSVCKAWKSLIDSSDFILNHITYQQHQHLLVRYKDALNVEETYVLIADNDTDTDTFLQHKVSVTIPQLVVNMGKHFTAVDSSHGLLCLFGYTDRNEVISIGNAVIWNPSIRKAVDVVLPHMADDDEIDVYRTVLGFGVCPKTIDPKIIKTRINTEDVIPWQVEVFTLSTRVWRSAYSDNVPSKFVRYGTGEQVVVGGVVYWLAEDSKVVYHVWVMKDGVPKLFEKLFTINGHSPDGSTVFLRGFRKTGEALIQVKANLGFNRTLAALISWFMKKVMSFSLISFQSLYVRCSKCLFE